MVDAFSSALDANFIHLKISALVFYSFIMYYIYLCSLQSDMDMSKIFATFRWIVKRGNFSHDMLYIFS